MKPNRSINYIRIALSCLVLIPVLIWLGLPVLAMGIAQISGNPIQPEKLDIRPIPVPEPPEPVAGIEPLVSGAPSPSGLANDPVPQPIPVPLPSISATQTAPVLAERRIPESPTAVTVYFPGRQGIIAMVLMFIALISFVWSNRVSSLHPLIKGHA